MCVDLSLGFLFCSIDLYFCLCASTVLSWWLWLCSRSWSQVGASSWEKQIHKWTVTLLRWGEEICSKQALVIPILLFFLKSLDCWSILSKLISTGERRSFPTLAGTLSPGFPSSPACAWNLPKSLTKLMESTMEISISCCSCRWAHRLWLLVSGQRSVFAVALTAWPRAT